VSAGSSRVLRFPAGSAQRRRGIASLPAWGALVMGRLLMRCAPLRTRASGIAGGAIGYCYRGSRQGHYVVNAISKLVADWFWRSRLRSRDRASGRWACPRTAIWRSGGMAGRRAGRVGWGMRWGDDGGVSRGIFGGCVRRFVFRRCWSIETPRGRAAKCGDGENIGFLPLLRRNPAI